MASGAVSSLKGARCDKLRHRTLATPGPVSYCDVYPDRQ